MSARSGWPTHADRARWQRVTAGLTRSGYAAPRHDVDLDHGPASRFARLIRFCAAFLVIAGPWSGALGQSHDARFLDGLRQRQLFELAESYCRQQLSIKEIDTARRVELVIELARSYAEHARHSAPDQRQPLWTESLRTLSEYRKVDPDNSRELLIRAQEALILFSQGDLLRQEAEFQGSDSTSWEQARTTLRQAITALKSVDEAIGDELTRMGRSSPTVQTGLSVNELVSLRNNVNYQWARGLRSQATCFAETSPDRVNALTQAIERLQNVANATQQEELHWRCLIGQAECQRLLKRFDQARGVLGQLQTAPLPPELAADAKAEEARLALDEGRPEKALELLRSARPEQGPSRYPELDLALLETYIATWKRYDQVNDAPRATSARAKTEQIIKMIEQQHGLYWLRRGDLLLDNTTVRAAGAGSTALLDRRAESLYRRGRIDEAVSIYDQAAQNARTEGQRERAFDLDFRAAAMEYRAGQHANARDRFRRLALADPAHERAAEAHLLAVLSSSLHARQQASSPLDEYAALLDEHLRYWPGGTTADKVRWWRGRLYEHQAQWPEAVSSYRGVSTQFGQYESVLASAARAYTSWLEQLQQDQQPYLAVAQQAAEFFESVIRTPGGQLPRDWSPGMSQAALSAAELRMRFTDNGFVSADGTLSAALATAREAPADWQSRARALLVVALAGQQKWPQARSVLSQLVDDSPTPFLSILEELSRLVQSERISFSADFGRLQLQIVERIETSKGQLSPSDRLLVTRTQAESLAATGQFVEALAIFEALSKQFPDDGRIQEGYASVLLDSGDAKLAKRALDQWRKVLARSRPDSQRWFRAKYSIALAHYRLGQPDRAAKIIQLTQALYPKMGGENLKQEFERLLSMCTSPAP